MSHNLVNPVDINDSTDTTKKVRLDPSGANTSTTATITTAQTTNRTYSIPDSGASAAFVMTEGSQTINGTKTFKTSLKIQETSGTDNITIQAPALAVGYTLTLPVDDGTSNNQVLTTDGSGVLSWQSFLPAGMLLPFAGTSTPSGFLLCNGSVVSQTTYANLFAAIGSTWNTGGEGAGNFRLPNLSRRTLVGSGGSGSATLANTTGSTGGEENHQLTIFETVLHNHALTGGGFGTGAATSVVTDPGHLHAKGTLTADSNTTGITIALTPENGGSDFNWDNNADGTGTFTSQGTQVTDPGHPHTISGSTASNTTGITVATTLSGMTDAAGWDNGSGGPNAHNTMQPSAVVTYVIKY